MAADTIDNVKAKILRKRKRRGGGGEFVMWGMLGWEVLLLGEWRAEKEWDHVGMLRWGCCRFREFE